MKNYYKQFIKWQYNKFFPQTIIELPQSYKTLNFQQMWELLKKKFIVDISNDIYELTTVEEALKFLTPQKLYEKRWIENVYDCDIFSRAAWNYFNENLMQFAFGYARSSNHRFNFMVDKDLIFWIYEPQENVFFKYDDYLKGKIKKKLDYKITLLLI